MNKHNTRAVLLGFFVALASSLSHSALVSGALEFAGTVKKTSGLATNATNFGSNNSISLSTGDFSGLISIGTQFSMVGVNLGLVPVPASSSWTIGNFSVVLDSASILPDGSPDPLDMFGTGTITDLNNQFDVTQITWSFSETPFTASKSLYSFRIDTVSEVPVPAAGWLMMSALAATGLARFKRRNKQ